MGLAHSPRIVTTNLLLNVDAGNSKNYDGRENLLTYSQLFTNAIWTGGNLPVFTSGITAPDGSGTAFLADDQYTLADGASITQSITIAPSLTTNYTVSIYAKQGTASYFDFYIFFVGNSVKGSYFRYTFSTNTISAAIADGVGVVPTNTVATVLPSGWVRLSFTVSDANNGLNTTLQYRIYPGSRDTGVTGSTYLWGAQVVIGSNLTTYVPTTSTAITKSTILYDTIGNRQFNISNNTWLSFANSSLTFTRPANTSPNPKIGAVVANTATGSLASPNFLYNDHTWEIWFRIDDRTPGAYDPTEGYSVLAAYQGYHSGFMYTSSSLDYFIWDSVGPTNKWASTWTVGVSGTQIVQNNWTQIVVTRSGNTFTPYINGVQLGTGSTITTNTFTSTSNTLSIGSASQAVWTVGQGGYSYFSKSTFSNMKMYNRALTPAEIAQNFDALRGRFGI